MSDVFFDARQHALYRILNAPVRDWPHKHVVVEDVFPESFYARIRQHMPAPNSYTPLAGTGKVAKGDYDMRSGFLLNDSHLSRTTDEIGGFWTSLFEDVFSEDFSRFLLERHAAQIGSRFLREDVPMPDAFKRDMILVRDGSSDGVKIHTSDSKNVITLLFYLPEDERHVDCGTTLYLPKDRDFRSWGGTHYDFEKFEKVTTIPYRPNTLFMFVKDDDSFHGVEPMRIEGLRRDLLLFYVHR